MDPKPPLKEKERRRMIAHIVLLQPKPELTEAQRGRCDRDPAWLGGGPAGFRRFRLGRRVTHGLPGYEQLMPQDYEFALIIEVDDVAALTRYLKAPAHVALGHLFSTATAAALAYDYALEDVGVTS